MWACVKRPVTTSVKPNQSGDTEEKGEQSGSLPWQLLVTQPVRLHFSPSTEQPCEGEEAPAARPEPLSGQVHPDNQQTTGGTATPLANSRSEVGAGSEVPGPICKGIRQRRLLMMSVHSFNVHNSLECSKIMVRKSPE